MDPLFDRDARATETEAQRIRTATAHVARSRPSAFAGCRSARWRRGTGRASWPTCWRLSERDRYLRFGYVATDAQIERYVEQLDFERDEVFGIFNRRLELVAMAHLAYLDQPRRAGRRPSSASRWPSSSRGRGYGARLFDHAALHARNRGIDTLLIHALSENTAMLRIARNAGARSSATARNRRPGSSCRRRTWLRTSRRWSRTAPPSSTTA